MNDKSFFVKPIPDYPEGRFWQWLEDSKDFLIKAYEEKNYTLVTNSIGLRLEEIDSGLDFEFGKDEDGNYDLIFSACGSRKLIDRVIELYKTSPTWEGWRFTAFKPRAAESTLHFQDKQYSGDSVYYGSVYADDLTHITIFFSDFTNEEEFFPVAFMMLDMLLGEYDVMTCVGEIYIDQLPENPESQGLRLISNLVEEIDSRKPYMTAQ